MTLLEVHADLAEVKDELRLCRIALEAIAQALLKLTEIPAEPPPPPKPPGKEAVGNYASVLMAMEGEEAEELRERLRAAGLTDEQIESQVIRMFTAGVSDETTA